MAVFDKYADNYDEGHKKAVSLSGYDPSYFDEYKVKILADILSGMDHGKSLKIMNYGCGTGKTEGYIQKYMPGVNVYGIDVSEESVRVARANNAAHTNISFDFFDGKNIPGNEMFDVVFCANVFHHIPRKSHKDSMHGIYSRLKPGGLFVIFELNPINPLTQLVAIQNDYKFDPDANLLSPYYLGRLLRNEGFKDSSLRFTIFLPSFLSKLALLENYLAWLPLGAHYYYTVRK
ncbi:MAG TPA: class I SAM-dependent methyltransferase [Chlorobaculum sp.]|nr:class I SAM-dependent methyltransferase [Chlorobaculum sp.]